MNKYLDKNRLGGIAIHALVWIAIFSLPSLLEFLIRGSITPHSPMGIIVLLHILTLFYINYFLYINRLLINRRRFGGFILLNVVTMIALTVLTQAGRRILFADAGVEIPGNYAQYSIIAKAFGIAAIAVFQSIVVVICVAVRMTGQWYEAQRMLQELGKATSQAELQHLKSQLNPHFLFNSLNNIYALIGMDSERARLSLQSLCELLRYQLYEANREMLPLQKEVEFVRSYCELMSLRLPKNVELNIELPDVEERVMIAPLLFISIIENAFKHGISQSEPSRIGIKITFEQGRVACIVRNTNLPKSNADRSGSGIGLENLRRRLDLLYPKSHSFRTELQGNEFVAQLMINLHL